MSTDTAVKKRIRSKKATEADEVVVADSSASVQATAKKTRARKAVSKTIEDATPAEVAQDPPKAKKPREVKKKEVLKTTTTNPASKLAAKTSGNELQHEDSPDNASQILQQATAFADEKRGATKDIVEPPVQLDHAEVFSKPTEYTLAPMPSDTQSGKLNKANATRPEKASTELRSIEAASPLPTKPSSFLNSFLNDPEPAPVHPPPEQQKRIEFPGERRADLKQATKHDFEDSILSPRGIVKAQRQPTSRPSSIPSAVAALMESSNAAVSSARLRAFTTSSFAALKAGNKSKQTTSNATASTSAPTGPAPTTTSLSEATPEHRKPPFKAPPPSSTAPPKHPAPAAPPPSKPATLPRAYPSGSLPQSPPRRPAPMPPPRPTDLSYDQLQKNAQYKSLRRKWTGVMVSIPFLVYSSYELWRRWDRGDFGRAKMERDRRVGIEEELRGFDRGIAGGRGVGETVKVPGRTNFIEETNGQLLHETPEQKSDVVAAGTEEMETVSGRQQSTGTANDVEAGREESPVLGRLPGLEMDSGSTEVRDLLREGGSKRGWVQVFR